MAASVGSPHQAATPASVGWRSGWPSRIFALTPLWVLVISPLVAPTYFGKGLGGSHSSIVEANLVIVVTGLVMLWMLIGLYVLWNARTWHTVVLVYAWFTIPATVAVVLTPALVLILQNLR